MSKAGKEKLVVGNWKMNLTVPESTILAERLRKQILFTNGVEAVVSPTHVSLYAVSKDLMDSPIEVAAQNVFWEEEGAFTGEVSPEMIRGFAKYCIVGHSERRRIFNESDKDVAKKVRALLSFGIKPIICVGETLKDKNEGLGKVVATSQLEAALSFISKEDLDNIVIVYEPIWAIGTGSACEPKDAMYVVNAIKKFLKALYGEKNAERVKILYGGSVTSKVVESYLKEDLDGFLVGNASLDHEEFTNIVRATYRIINKSKVSPKGEK